MMSQDIEVIEPVGPADDAAAQGDLQPVQAIDVSSAANDDVSIKNLQDRLALQGRELAEARRISQAQASQVADLTDAVQRMGATLNANEQARVNAYLNSIEDPGTRAMEEVKILKRQLQTAGNGRPVQQPQQPTPRVESPEDYRDRRSREILAEVNQRYGTAITANETDDDGEPLLDFSSEQTFAASARALGAALKKSSATKESLVPKSAAATSSKSAEPKPVNSPAAPRPAPVASSASVSKESYDSVFSAGGSGKKAQLRGPKALVGDLREQRERAARALPT